ncbi:MAG: type II toxin-antitoxin system HipA family toxin [Desulfuromonadales bacterium]|nr:type II toxin-antitoxin system HipA family toxin [Desulfuromonadales bacterium]MBN2793670.1 type II toxin-antitoxin system HipA family toxin [Desulfuromonadales bacterium]
METLDVYLNRLPVGRLTHEAGRLSFRYLPEYQSAPQALPLSRHLPLNHDLATVGFDDAASRAFFENLLPEGNLRTQIVRRLGISPENIFALLNELGGDCAGAVRLLPQGQGPREHGGYRLLSETALTKRLANLPVHPMLADEDGVRLSLAGAQNKLPLHYDGENFFIPEKDAPSTHILKTPIERLDNTVVNEAFCMNLAQRTGLKVPVATVVEIDGSAVYLVERYDRRRTDDGFIRLHQEDFCQALGVESAGKYEKEGGPGFAACFGLLREWSDEPLADVAALLRWALFNFLIGNADAHGKNISFLYADGEVRLAPFYDLISTAVYEDQINNKFAMRMGGRKDPRYLVKSDLEKFAAEIGIGLRGVTRELARLLAEIEPAAAILAEEYHRKYADPPVVGRIRQVLQQRMDKAEFLLSR